jgi:hypothetical protein
MERRKKRSRPERKEWRKVVKRKEVKETEGRGRQEGWKRRKEAKEGIIGRMRNEGRKEEEMKEERMYTC